MEDYQNKWVQQIIQLQHDDGSWGYFHSISKPTKAQPITTEQALRRLRILGLTKEDIPIKRALNYIRSILSGVCKPPDRREKVLNWDAFETQMMAAWLRIFDADDSLALPVANMWSEIIARVFEKGNFNEEIYACEYRKYFPVLHQGERLISLCQFYMVNLLQGVLDRKTESKYFEFLLHHNQGIYYVYDSKISVLPAVFASKQTSNWLAALEQLAGYTCAKEKLRFAMDWVIKNQDKNGKWDLGVHAKDGVYFPLSDSWRKEEYRKRDCTVRIEKLLQHF